MNQQIVTLKHYVLELEHAIANQESDVVKMATQRIGDLCRQIDYDFKSVKEKETGVYFKTINTIPFLYKPVDALDPFDGDYLERYARERTEQLTRAGAIGEHNAFWKDHNVMRGTIFGSVPLELLSEDAVFALKRMGWLETKVDVLDFGKRVTDFHQVLEFCEGNFRHYIMLSEESTQSTIALKFAV